MILISTNKDMRVYEKELNEALEKWESGEMNNINMFELGENMIDVYPETNIPSLKQEKNSENKWFRVHENKHKSWRLIPLCIAVDCFAGMHTFWITKNDIPAIKKFLTATENESYEAWAEWDIYWSSLDWEKRRLEVEQMGWPYMFFEENEKHIAEKWRT